MATAYLAAQVGPIGKGAQPLTTVQQAVSGTSPTGGVLVAYDGTKTVSQIAACLQAVIDYLATLNP